MSAYESKNAPEQEYSRPCKHGFLEFNNCWMSIRASQAVGALIGSAFRYLSPTLPYQFRKNWRLPYLLLFFSWTCGCCQSTAADGTETPGGLHLYWQSSSFICEWSVMSPTKNRTANKLLITLTRPCYSLSKLPPYCSARSGLHLPQVCLQGNINTMAPLQTSTRMTGLYGFQSEDQGQKRRHKLLIRAN
jgi:hypothetical protein